MRLLELLLMRQRLSSRSPRRLPVLCPKSAGPQGAGRMSADLTASRVAADDPAPSDVARVDVISPRVQVLHLA